MYRTLSNSKDTEEINPIFISFFPFRIYLNKLDFFKASSDLLFCFLALADCVHMGPHAVTTKLLFKQTSQGLSPSSI